MGKALFRARNLTTGAILVVSLCACGGSRTASTIASDAEVGQTVVSFPNSVDHANQTRILANPFDQQAGVTGSALMVKTLDNGELDNQLSIDLLGNVGIRGHFVSLLEPVPHTGIDSMTDAEALLGTLPIGVYRLTSDPAGTLPHIGTIDSAPTGAESPAQPLAIDLTTSVAVNVAATKQLIREVAELKAEVAELKREVGR